MTGDVLRTCCIAALLVTACSDPHAAPLPSTSPSVSVSATTSPTPDYEAEVRHAVDAYFAALNAALRGPAHKTDALAALIAPSCPCREVLDLLHSEARDGRYLDYRYTVSDVRVQQAGEVGASLTWTAAQSAGHERTNDGRVTDSFPASTLRVSAHFTREGTRWLLDRLDRLR
jgi:hypothetical protein